MKDADHPSVAFVPYVLSQGSSAGSYLDALFRALALAANEAGGDEVEGTEVWEHFQLQAAGSPDSGTKLKAECETAMEQAEEAGLIQIHYRILGGAKVTLLAELRNRLSQRQA